MRIWSNSSRMRSKPPLRLAASMASRLCLRLTHSSLILTSRTPHNSKVCSIHTYCVPSHLFSGHGSHCCFSLDTPSKPHLPKEPPLDDKKRSVCPDTVSDESDSEQDKFDVLRTRFFGEVDLPECKFDLFMWTLIIHPSIGEEPLLKDSRRRFVLFLIQYHKVSTSSRYLMKVGLRAVCTRKPKHLFGPLKRWTPQRTSMTGTTV